MTNANRNDIAPPRTHRARARLGHAALLALTGVVGAAGWAAADKPQAAAPAATGKAAQIARGKLLATTSGCHDCHTPWKMGAQGPEPDMSRMLSGHPQAMVLPPAPKLPPGPWIVTVAATNTAWAGPWGTSFTANLTPDRETGLGTWTARTFIDTIRTGRHMGRGRPLLPPMPAAMYAHLPDSDLEALFAFLQSIPPVKNRVPAPLPPPTQVSAR